MKADSRLVRRNAGIWNRGVHNIAMLHSRVYVAGDVSASARYWEEDIIEPPVTVTPEADYCA